ncbi:hypothetical protein PUATCC27989T_03753 [Phytobacter ursingii]|nr:hypothetical protein PUATCC27989T_03753 [Phytobacter ursingii]
MRLWWSFRSPYVLCFSITTEPVNVPGRLTATALATRAPGQENRRWRGPLALCRLTFGSGTSLRPCRLSPPPASLRAAPVSRQRLIDFQPDPVIAVTVLFLLSGVIAVRRKITGDSSALREREPIELAFLWGSLSPLRSGTEPVARIRRLPPSGNAPSPAGITPFYRRVSGHGETH